MNVSDLPPRDYCVAALYRFAPVANPDQLADRLRLFGSEQGLTGSLILAHEGLNGTVAGRAAAVDSLLGFLASEPGFAGIVPRRHASDVLPFARWKVKVKPEIVTMGHAVDPSRSVGHYVAPADWNELISDPDTILIDTRNDYEVAIGSFAGAIDPGTSSFGDFPEWFDAQAERWRSEGRTPRIAMFCTGGIRCEKSTAFARARGFDEVYHLQGGILAYLAEVDSADSLWKGECFLFDERVSITHGEQSGSARPCALCGQPVLPGSAHQCPESERRQLAP